MSESKTHNHAYHEGWTAGMWNDLNTPKPENPYLPYTDQYKNWENGYYDGRLDWDMNGDYE